MAAKASRTHTLFLLIALAVAWTTVTVTVSPTVATAASYGPQNSGDPDRPNDAPKPTSATPTIADRLELVGVEEPEDTSEGGEGTSWNWVMAIIATLLGRRIL
jgi:hypothetical protein